MEAPRYLQVLWSGKWLLAVGIVVAAVAAFFAAFTFANGQVIPRATQSYTAGTTVLLSSPSQPLFQAVIPGQTVAEGETSPQNVDLTQKAILYAYLISGDDVRAQVEAQVGPFADTDALTALRRTTQPGGDEAFAGRYTLPIVEIVGTSLDPARAELISRTATAVFEQNVLDQQATAQIPEGARVDVTSLDDKSAVAVQGSNPAIPAVVTFLGVMLLFVVAVYILAARRASRRARAELAGEPAFEQATEADLPPVTLAGDPAAAPRPRPARRRTAVPVAADEVVSDAPRDTADELEPARAG